jgi:hypothetical protein
MVNVLFRPPSASFTTTFPSTENPINGTDWVRGFSDGASWTDPQSGLASDGTTHIAFGTQTASPAPPFDDSISHLRGFPADHYAEGTVFNAAADQIEIELLLRFAITNGNARGYEFDYVFSGTNTCNLALVRWNGSLGSFTVLNGGANVVTGLDISTGTIQRASITGNVITGTRNGSTIFTYDLNANFVADGSLIWNDGNPGIGFWDRSLSSGANRNTMGWSKFTANTP